MKIIKTVILLTLIFTVIGCNVYTSNTIYRSDPNNMNWIIQALNVNNCKCTQLYITHYSGKKIDFRIFYSDSIIRKTIYVGPRYSKSNNVKVLLASEKDDFDFPLDSLDIVIISKIKELNSMDSNILFKLKDKIIKGYILDPNYNQ